MFISAMAAVALFAAPDAGEGGGKPEAKPAMQRVCEKVLTVGSTVPRKKCVNVPVKVAESAESAEDKARDVAKTE